MTFDFFNVSSRSVVYSYKTLMPIFLFPVSVAYDIPKAVSHKPTRIV